MDILAAKGEGGQGSIEPADSFQIDHAAVGRFLLSKDPTAALFSSLRFMDGVEDWVLQRLSRDEKSAEDVRTRLHRLAEIVHQYRCRIPPDNQAFLQVASWLNTSVVLYVLDYLTQYQDDFMRQLIDYCNAVEQDDLNASLMLRRIRAIYRARLLDRIYSPENVHYVMSVLLKDSQ